MSQLQVKDIMSTELVTLEKDEDLALADTIMSLGRIRHLPVVSEGRLAGLVSHRDILRAQASLLADLSVSEDQEWKASVTASEVMRQVIRTVEPETTVLEAARLIYKNKVGCLPVVQDGQLVGIVTEADFVRLVIDGLEAERSDETAAD